MFVIVLCGYIVYGMSLGKGILFLKFWFIHQIKIY